MDTRQESQTGIGVQNPRPPARGAGGGWRVAGSGWVPRYTRSGRTRPPPLAYQHHTYLMKESSYRTLVAWQRAISLAADVYTFSKTFPMDECYGLTQQIRRSAVSVPSNIAEGRGRRSTRDYRHFLHQARGSLYEIDRHIALAERLGYCSASDAARIQVAIVEAVKPLQGLIASLIDRSATPPATRHPLSPDAMY